MGMRLSISTKIFVGFAVVIVAFTATNAYSLFTMSQLRRAVTVAWKEILPISNQLRGLSRQLKSAEELFAFKRPTDIQWLQQALPTIEPFHGPHGLASVGARLENIARDSDGLSAAERRAVTGIAARIADFVDGRSLVEVVADDALSAVLGDEAELISHELYDRLVRRTLKNASLGELSALSPESRAAVRVLRRLNREVGELVRDLAEPIRAIDQRVESEERTMMVWVIASTTGALALSLLVMWMSQLTLRPIRRLREGARRIAAGEYKEKVIVASSDEIGALAAEFNTMAESLMKRDAELERQREELLRAERLAIIGKLAAQITHEVRNPLSSIGLNAELLEDEIEAIPDAGEARASLRAIIAEVQRLRAITEEYLHFARLPRPDLRSVDVGGLLGEFLAFLSHELAEAGVEVTARGVSRSLEGGPPPIRADGDQLRQALLNIARNAIEALRGHEGPKRLEIVLEPRDGGGLRINITDTGPGIDPAIRERIFEPFVTGKSHGTGLGLALTREIIVEHGGTIHAVSPVGASGGTSFVIELPANGRAAGPP